MSKIARFFVDLYNDGFGFVGLLAPVASLATTLSKWAGVAVGGLQEISWAWVFIPITLWILAAYVRRWHRYREHVENPRHDALGLPQMPVTEISKYLLTESKWGWQMYARLNFWHFVEDHVAAEMKRAGTTHEVRYVGTLPNSARAEEIDRSYWRYADIDELRIWDDRNEFFTRVTPRAITGSGVQSYRYGSAPRSDVFRIWPRASFMRKIWALLFVRLKTLYWGAAKLMKMSGKWVSGKILALKKRVNKTD